MGIVYLDYQSELEAVEHGLSQYEEQETEALCQVVLESNRFQSECPLDRYAKHLPVLLLAGALILVMAFITWTIYLYPNVSANNKSI